MFKRRRWPTPTREKLVAEYMPTSSLSYSDGTDFPARRLLELLDDVSLVSYASGRRERETMVQLCVFVSRLIHDLPNVDPTPTMIQNLVDGRAWLLDNGLDPQAAELQEVQASIARYWEEAGAVERMAERLRHEPPPE